MKRPGEIWGPGRVAQPQARWMPKTSTLHHTTISRPKMPTPLPVALGFPRLEARVDRTEADQKPTRLRRQTGIGPTSMPMPMPMPMPMLVPDSLLPPPHSTPTNPAPILHSPFPILHLLSRPQGPRGSQGEAKAKSLAADRRPALRKASSRCTISPKLDCHLQIVPYPRVPVLWLLLPSGGRRQTQYHAGWLPYASIWPS